MNRIKISVVALIVILLFSTGVTFYTHSIFSDLNEYSTLAIDAARRYDTRDAVIYTEKVVETYNNNYYVLSIIIRTDHLQQLSSSISMAEHHLYYENYIELTALLGDIKSTVNQLEDENLPFLKNLL